MNEITLEEIEVDIGEYLIWVDKNGFSAVTSFDKDVLRNDIIKSIDNGYSISESIEFSKDHVKYLYSEMI